MSWRNHVVWSPDGTKIAFDIAWSGNNEEGSDIHVMKADGSDLVNLTDRPGDDYHPAWSPDGTKIAFVSDRDGEYEIYVINADGSKQTQLTDGAHVIGSFPQWSPP